MAYPDPDDLDAIAMAHCFACKEVKDASEFAPEELYGEPKRMFRCRACVNERGVEPWYLSDADLLLLDGDLSDCCNCEDCSRVKEPPQEAVPPGPREPRPAGAATAGGGRSAHETGSAAQGQLTIRSDILKLACEKLRDGDPGFALRMLCSAVGWAEPSWTRTRADDGKWLAVCTLADGTEWSSPDQDRKAEAEAAAAASAARSLISAASDHALPPPGTTLPPHAEYLAKALDLRFAGIPELARIWFDVAHRAAAQQQDENQGIVFARLECLKMVAVDLVDWDAVDKESRCASRLIFAARKKGLWRTPGTGFVEASSLSHPIASIARRRSDSSK